MAHAHKNRHTSTTCWAAAGHMTAPSSLTQGIINTSVSHAFTPDLYTTHTHTHKLFPFNQTTHSPTWQEDTMKLSVEYLLKLTKKDVKHNVKVKPSVSTVRLIQLLIVAATSGWLGNLGDQKQWYQTVTTALFFFQINCLWIQKEAPVNSHSNHSLNLPPCGN